MKKLTYLFVACMVSLVVASCGGGSNSSEADRIAQLEDSIARMNKQLNNAVPSDGVNAESNSNVSSVNASENDVVGTYEVKDHLDQVWIFTLNADESATVTKKGGDAVGYGSWSDDRYDNGIWFDFEEEPRIVFPNMQEGFFGHGDMNSGYLYRTVNAAKSKDPHQRLEMKKIK